VKAIQSSYFRRKSFDNSRNALINVSPARKNDSERGAEHRKNKIAAITQETDFII
jgi:hypothetical protein